MDVPEFDKTVLANIAGCDMGRSREELVNKYGCEISETIDFLLKNELIEEHKQNISPFMPPDSDYKDPPIGNFVVTRSGEIEVKRWRSEQSTAARQRWKERAVSFFLGVLVAVLSGLILAWISK